MHSKHSRYGRQECSSNRVSFCVCVFFFYIILALPHMAGSFLICQWLEKDVQRCENKHSPPREYSPHSYLTLRWAYAWPVCKAAWFILVQTQLLLWPKSSRLRTASPHERSADATEWTLQRAGKQKILFKRRTTTATTSALSKDLQNNLTRRLIKLELFILIFKNVIFLREKNGPKNDKCYNGNSM